MSKKTQGWVTLAGLFAVQVVVHKATDRQAAALGLPLLAVAAAGFVLAQALS